MRFSSGRGLPLGALAAFLLAACAAGPQPIRYGEEECAYCRMTVGDQRFGAQLLTAKGRTRTFDSIECMASDYLASTVDEAPRAMLVTNFARLGTMLPVNDAIFLRDPRLHSPMGMGLVAVGSRADAERVAGGADLLTWGDVLALVRAEGPAFHRHDDQLRERAP